MAEPKTKEKLGIPCPHCRSMIPYSKLKCPKCGEWNFGSSNSDEEQEVVRLSDAKISVVARLPTLCPDMDRFFGGGLVKTSTSLLSGEPGSGKTSLFLQLCDCIIDFYLEQGVDRNRGANAIYVANEQTPDEIRNKAIELGVKNLHQVCIVKAMGGFTGSLFDVVEKYKPRLMIVDSLTKLVGRDMELAVVVAQMFKELLTVKLEAPTLFVGQVTKDLNHAGLEKLQHEVDMTAMLTKIGTKRVLESEKNRNGEAPLSLAMQMRGPEDFAAGRGGLDVLGIVGPGDEEEGSDDPPVSRAGEDGQDVPGPKRKSAA